MTINSVDARVIRSDTGSFWLDNYPDDFQSLINDNIDVPISGLSTSNPFTPVGTDVFATSPISVDIGEYSLNGGSFSSSPGTWTTGDSVRLKHTASGSGTTDTIQTVNISGRTGTFTSTTAAASSGDVLPPTDSRTIWYSSFDGSGLLPNVRLANNTGSPYFTWVDWLGGGVGSYPTDGDGTDNVATHQNVISDNSAEAQGSPAGLSDGQSWALKTHYVGDQVDDGTSGKSFSKNHTAIKFSNRRELYFRWYQKWSSQWEWPSGQQKFCKVLGDGGEGAGVSQNVSMFRNNRKKSEIFYQLDGDNEKGQNIDESNDDLPGNGVSMTTGVWHEFEGHVIVSEPSQSNGVIELWWNGKLMLAVYNIQNHKNDPNPQQFINLIEIQHVYENNPGTNYPNDDLKEGPRISMPTWFKNIQLATTRIGVDR